jgi:hypothetical protein
LGAVLATLAVVALLVWFAAEDARQADLLDARIQEAKFQDSQALDRVKVLINDGAPVEEVRQAELERSQAVEELLLLYAEQARRQQSWPALLREEVRRRACSA